MASNTSNAFVSYSRADSDFTLQLVGDLKAAGANVWLDQLDIEPGTPWDSAIEAALLGSTHMLVVLSTVSVTSDNVRDEVSYALSQQMKVIPVLYHECKVPFRLARLQHIDFRNDYTAALKALLKTLHVEQQVTPSPIASPAPPSEEKASLADAAERQRREEEDRLKAQRAEHLAQQAQWEEERRQQLAQQAQWEEERRLREQAEAARQAEAAQQAEAARKAELAREAEAGAARQAERVRQDGADRLTEAERRRAAAERTAQERKQEQEAKAQAAQDTPPPPPVLFASINPGVTDSPQPQLERSTSTLSLLGRIAIYAVVAGLLRAICSFASYSFGWSTSRSYLFGSYYFGWSTTINAIFIGGVTGLVLYRVLLVFKPEVGKKQLQTIFWVWVAAKVVLTADANLFPSWGISYEYHVYWENVLPTAIAGAITGLILTRALQAVYSSGISIGIVSASFAIPSFFGQWLWRVYEPYYATFESNIIGIIVVDFCPAVIEVGVLLWFIRDWGRHDPPNPQP